MMLSPMVVFKDTAYYKGWYTEVTDEKHAMPISPIVQKVWT